jgi:hypothetical protein
MMTIEDQVGNLVTVPVELLLPNATIQQPPDDAETGEVTDGVPMNLDRAETDQNWIDIRILPHGDRLSAFARRLGAHYRGLPRSDKLPSSFSLTGHPGHVPHSPRDTA